MEDAAEVPVTYFSSDNARFHPVASLASTSEHLRSLNLAADDGVGLTAEQVHRLVRGCITKAKKVNVKSKHLSFLSSGLTRNLLSCLIPREALRGATAATLLAWALANAADANAKSNAVSTTVLRPVLKWVHCCLTHDICPLDELQHLYEPLFQFTSKSGVASLACQILAALTVCGRFVTPWRVRRLTSLWHDAVARKTTAVPAITNLLIRFRRLRPDLIAKGIVLMVSSRRRPAASGPASKMELRFATRWRKRVARDDRKHFAAAKYDSGPPPDKRTRSCLVPECSTCVSSSAGAASVTIGECAGPRELQRNLHAMRKPDQALGIMRDKRNFILLLLKPSAEDDFIERFSLTLYQTLHDEFSSATSSAPAEHVKTRRTELLKAVHDLQTWLQQGIPVVSRFLAEYLASVWDGRQHFVEILRLIAYIQITEFEELNSCILLPLLVRFESYSTLERISILHYIQQLLEHWIHLEYKRHDGGGDASAAMPPLIFPRANDHCQNSLQSISELLAHFSELTELGLLRCGAIGGGSGGGDHTGLYLNRVLLMHHQLTRLLIKCRVPLRSEIPFSLCYLAIGHVSPVHISPVLEHLTIAKHESFPLSEKATASLRSASAASAASAANMSAADADIEAVEAQLAGREGLNSLAKDMVAVFSEEFAVLERGKSIFRGHWQIDDDEIRSHLGVATHLAFLPYSLRFAEKYAGERGMSVPDVRRRMRDDKSTAHDQYVKYLEKHLPNVAGFLQTFCRGPRPSAQQRPALTGGEGSQVSTRSGKSQPSSTVTGATSGYRSAAANELN